MKNVQDQRKMRGGEESSLQGKSFDGFFLFRCSVLFCNEKRKLEAALTWRFFSVQLVRSRISTFGVNSPQKTCHSTPKIEIKVF